MEALDRFLIWISRGRLVRSRKTYHTFILPSPACYPPDDDMRRWFAANAATAGALDEWARTAQISAERLRDSLSDPDGNLASAAHRENIGDILDSCREVRRVARAFKDRAVRV